MKPKTPYLVLLLIILLGLGLRLYHLTYPYLDHHSWRQTDTAAIARNFLRHGFNILKPEVDWAGRGPSVAELELQVTPILTAVFYELWGIRDWVGRIVPILFWVAGILYYYRLVKSQVNETTALFSSSVLAVLPLSVFFTRVPMPESGVMLFSVASIYHLSAHLEQGASRHFYLALLFTTLTFLSKLTYLFLLVPLIFTFVENRRTSRVPIAKVAALLIVALTVTFAYYAYMHYTADVKLIPYKLGSDKWGNISMWVNPVFYRVMFARLQTVVFTKLGALFLVAGLFMPAGTRLFHAWLLGALGYVFAIATGNLVHSYYQMPLIPPGAFFIGLTLSRIYTNGSLKPAAVVAFGSLLVLAAINLLPMYGMYALPAYEAAMKLKEIDRSNSLVLFVPDRPDINPEMLYYADRRGWVVWPTELTITRIEESKRRGAAYLVITGPQHLTENLQRYIAGRESWSGKRYLIVRLSTSASEDDTRP